MNTAQTFPPLAMHFRIRYGSPVAANSATGRENPISKRRNSAQTTTVGVFLRLRFSVMAAVCGQASAWPGSFCPGILTPCTAATQSREKDGSGSPAKGAVPMQHILRLNPSKIRALAHRRMALSALRADSSLATRLKRYSHHMTIVRALEVQGGAE